MTVPEIADRLGRVPSTIYRELKRNFFDDEELPELNGHHAVVAQEIYEHASHGLRYRSRSTAELRDVFSAHRSHLLAAVDLFHAAVDHGTFAREYYRLTARQIEVLKWKAEGYLNKQIADRLGISESALNQHIKAATQNLQSATVTQAVVKAVTLKIIS